MRAKEEKIIGRRLKTSRITTVASITLVLFVLGLLGLVVLYAQRLSEQIRENIQLTLFLTEEAGLSEAAAMQSRIETWPAVRSTEYVSREQAAEDLSRQLGEDFIGFLGYNPLSAVIQLRVNAQWAQPDSLEKLSAGLMNLAHVEEVSYQKDLVHLVHDNVQKIGLVLLLFSLLLLLIAFALINNTIRLSVFSKRFLIKSMQLVGATPGFIRRPFVLGGLLQGLIAALLSNALLLSGIYAIEQRIPGLGITEDISMLAALMGVVLLLGIIISWFSAFLAVRKYLRLKTDSLYYY